MPEKALTTFRLTLSNPRMFAGQP